MEYGALQVRDFAERLASGAPVPGGGSASALVGALGIALGNMVGNLTVGRKKYADVEPQILALNLKAEALRMSLFSAMQQDIDNFEPLAQAYKIPKTDPAREQILENALIKACEAPLDIMINCCRAISLLDEYRKIGTKMALSDVGCGAALCRAAMQAASLNVFINTKGMKDRECAEKLNQNVVNMLFYSGTLADQIYEDVNRQLQSVPVAQVTI